MALALVLGGVCVSAEAQAQSGESAAALERQNVAQDLPIPRGEGLAVGQLRLHPGLQLATGYDNNVFYEDAQEAPLSATTLHIRPTLSATIPKPNRFALVSNLEVAYLQYFGDEQAVSDQSGVTVRADLAGTVNPNGAVAVRVYDYLRRTNEASNGLSFESYNRFYNQIGANVIVQPGGKVLTGEVGLNFTNYDYGYLETLNKTRFGLDAQVKWKFLPKTALLLVADWGSISYDTQAREIPFKDEDDRQSFLDPFVGAQGLQNIDSDTITVQAGLAGLVLPRLSVELMAGYTGGLYDAGEDFHGLTGRAAVAWEIGPTSRFRLGYLRGIQDSTFSNYVAFHRVSADYKQQIWRFDIDLGLSYVHQQYATVAVPILDQVSVDGQLGAPAFSTADRVDPLIIGLANVDFLLGDLFTVGVRYHLDVNTSNFVMITGLVAPSANRDPNDINTSGTATAQFVKHRVLLTTGVRW